MAIQDLHANLSNQPNPLNYKRNFEGRIAEPFREGGAGMRIRTATRERIRQQMERVDPQAIARLARSRLQKLHLIERRALEYYSVGGPGGREYAEVHALKGRLGS